MAMIKKKSSIKKWEQTYTVPIPYFGLMEITRDRTTSGNYGNNNTDSVWYWGDIEKVFDGIPIEVSVGIFGSIEYFDIGNHSGLYDDDITEERYHELKDLAFDNRSGASVASYSGKVVIKDTSLDSPDRASYYNYIVGTGRDYGGIDFGNFMSIEDAIARVGEIVEQFFPQVMEYVNQEKMASTKKTKKSKVKKGYEIGDIWDRIDILKDELGCENLLEETYKALSSDKANEILEYIARNHGVEFDEPEYYASAKKSTPKASFSLNDSVNKMRKSNYAKLGNINQKKG